MTKHDGKMRIIKTARTRDAINDAAKAGFRPLVQWLEPSEDISANMTVHQHKETGEIRIIGDLRSGSCPEGGDWEVVVEWSKHYPYYFPSPFAAYLIPKDLRLGETVYLEDLIEDIPSGSWQTNTYRMQSCEAMWYGTHFELLLDSGSYDDYADG